MNDGEFFDRTRHPTLVHVLRARAEAHPARTAFEFLGSRQAPDETLTYGELDRRARAVAARLTEEGCRGAPVLLLHRPGLDFIAGFFGALYAGAIAVPAYPPAGKKGQSVERLAAVVSDCGARAVLADAPAMADRPAWEESAPLLGTRAWIQTDPLADASFDDARLDADRLAFLQYTSGSTGQPKGVMVSHANLMHNLECIRGAFAGDPEADHGVFWLPQYHDMGLIGGLLLTCWAGSRSTIFSPIAFVKRPLFWLRTITKTRATISGGPNFAYELCLKTITDDALAELDLSSWRIAFSGSEPVQADTCRRFRERFAACGFRADALQPGYGMAETTLIVSARPPGSPVESLAVDRAALEDGTATSPSSSEASTRDIVSCGRPVPGLDIRIVEPSTKRVLPDRSIGEVWVRGESVAQGYWRRPQTSEAVFRAQTDGGDGPYLRTGDLGFLHDDELYVTGRLKELLIFCGKNHYPLDIEKTVLATDDELLGCVALGVDSGSQGNEEKLVIVCQPRNRDGLSARATAIRFAVSSEHGVAVHDVVFVGAGQITRTSSGKIQRLALAERYQRGDLKRLSVAKAVERSELVSILRAEIAARRSVDPEAVDIHAPFVTYGLSSIDAVRITGVLEERLGYALSPTLAFEYPTVDALARFLASGEEPERDAVRETASTGDVAIVGMACRLPGAGDLAAFEALLRAGTDAVGPMPDSRRMDDDAHPVGGYLDHVDRFAAEFFGIDPAEAAAMDPQQRLLLETTWRALEDAGLPPARLAGSATGVFVGIASADYALERFGDPHAHPHSHVAQAHSIAANRISYTFDFAGPSIAVDTACSSSLVALNLACQSLRAGECELGVVGGVNVLLARSIYEQFERGGYMSPDGRCKAFDASADGYVRGEGVAAVIVKPLARAEADGDRIYAVVRGTATNQDGRTNGITAPSRRAQEDVLRTAYARAGVDPSRVGLIEAHGTGTPLGDPIEARALGAVVSKERSGPCRLGSVKTNIGHLEAGAGIAGLVKVALSLYRGALFPNSGFETPSPHCELERHRLQVQTECEPWPEGVERIAGVSSFGFGGTNAHAVLSAYESVRPAKEVTDRASTVLLPLSATEPASLQVHGNAVAECVANGVSVEDAAFTMGARRSHEAHRVAVLCRSGDDTAAAAEIRRAAERIPTIARGGRERVAFVFGGQGGQWLGMGRGLFETQPVYRASFEHIAAAIEREAGWSPLAPPDLERIDCVQPMLFAVGVSLSHLLRAWGVEPDVMIGQSMGEVIAATAAGALSVEDGVRAIVRRSALMAQVAGSGTMAVVDRPAREMEERLAGSQVSVAVHMSPTACVLAGDDDAMRDVCDALERDGVGVRPVRVDVASHSALVDPLAAPLASGLSTVSGRPDHVPLISTVTTEPLTGDAIDADYLWRNLREPVRFAGAIERAVSEGVGLFIEVGPHPVVTTSVKECLRARETQGVAVGTLARDTDDLASLLEAVATVYERGHDVNWAALQPLGELVDVPVPPLRGQSFWTSPPARRTSSDTLPHPLLDREVRTAAESDARVFEVSVSASAFPELTHHRLMDAPILSAGAWLELAHAAVSHVVTRCALRDVAFVRMLEIPPSGAETLQVVVRDGTFTIYRDAGESGWVVHVEGRYEERSDGPRPLPELSSASRAIAPAELYASLAQHGLSYDPACQRLADVRLDARVSEVRIDAHDDLAETGYTVHPTLFDMALQALAPLVDPTFSADTPLTAPAVVERVGVLSIHRRPEGAIVARARRRDDESVDLVIADEDGVFAEAAGLGFASAAERLRRGPSYWRKTLHWSRTPRRTSAPASGRWAVVGATGSLKNALVERARQLPDVEPLLEFDLPRRTGESEGIAHQLIPHRSLNGIVFCIEGAHRGELDAFVRFAQLMGERGGPPVHLVTRGACGVRDDEPRNPLHAAVSAAARAGWAEDAFRGSAIDLDASIGRDYASEAAFIWREIHAADEHRLVAFRDGERFQPRLLPALDASTSAPAQPFHIDPRATYLITGGASALGLHAAKWLARRGAKRLLLCGRSESAPSAVAELEAMGASVRYRSVDVTDRAAVAALAAASPDVAGIVHAAGVVTPAPFETLNETTFQEAFAPKAHGAELLKRYFGRLELFVLYASSSAWLGSLARGLGHYAAANAYLDALAAGSRRTIAIQWPPWHAIGRVASAASGGHFAALGVATIAPEEADAILDDAFGRGQAGEVLCAVDRSRYVCRGLDDRLLGDLDDGAVGGAPDAASAPYEPPVDRLEERLAEAWQEVLGIDQVGRSDSFFALGGDSIKAATLLNRLRRHTSDAISIVALFEAPTVANLAAYLREHHANSVASIESEETVESGRVISQAQRASDLLARLDELSLEEVEVLIEERSRNLAQ